MFNYIKINKIEILLFCLVLFSAIFWRFTNYSNRWTLSQDQARDAIIALEAIKEKGLPLLGPPSSAGPFSFGPTYYFLIIFFTILSSIVSSLAALINGIFAKNFDEVAFFQNFILTPLIYLGGIFYSIHSLPAVWQKISLINPLVYTVNGFRYGFFGFSDVDPSICVGVLSVLTMSLAAINWVLLKKGIGLKN